MGGIFLCDERSLDVFQGEILSEGVLALLPSKLPQKLFQNP